MERVMRDIYTITYSDGSKITGILLPQANSNYYRFIDIVNCYVWSETFRSRKDFEERYTTFAALAK